MSQPETDIVHAIQIDASKSGARLMKNTRGQFYTLDSVRALVAAVKTWNPATIHTAIRNLRQVSAGIQVKGSSDLIGFVPLVITPDMVGTTMAIYCAVEVKAGTQPTREQIDFVDFVRNTGGYAGIARSVDDARKIMRITA